MTSTIRGNDNFDSSKIMGVGQTWQDMTSSRAIGSTYTNSTGAPLYVAILGGYSTGATITVNGYSFGASTSGGQIGLFNFIVPPSHTYSITGLSPLTKWSELR